MSNLERIISSALKTNLEMACVVEEKMQTVDSMMLVDMPFYLTEVYSLVEVETSVERRLHILQSRQTK